MFQDITKWNELPIVTSNAKKKKVITVHQGYPYTFSFEEHEEELKCVVNKSEKNL